MEGERTVDSRGVGGRCRGVVEGAALKVMRRLSPCQDDECDHEWCTDDMELNAPAYGLLPTQRSYPDADRR